MKRNRINRVRAAFLLLSLLFLVPAAGRGQRRQQREQQILRAEDERRAGAALVALLAAKQAAVRSRAALALGRIGESDSVAPLVALLSRDRDPSVRATAAFALGEIEWPEAIEALRRAYERRDETARTRARAIEALGKIAAALPNTLPPAKNAAQSGQISRAVEGALRDATEGEIGRAVESALRDTADGKSAGQIEIALAALTAALRARMTGAAPLVARHLKSSDARVRADAANTLARLRVREFSEQLAPLLTDEDAVVRANAARALAAGANERHVDALLALTVKDPDERVRVSALRTLAGDQTTRRADITAALLDRADELMPQYYRAQQTAPLARPSQINELLEIAAALGRLSADTKDGRALEFLRALCLAERGRAPEVEIALARVAPALYVADLRARYARDRSAKWEPFSLRVWQFVSATAQGLAEIATITSATKDRPMTDDARQVRAAAIALLRARIDDARTPPLAAADLLRAWAAYEPDDLTPMLSRQLKASDVMARATVAELSGATLSSAPKTNLAERENITGDLIRALPAAVADPMNDAALAILDALGKARDSAAATSAIESALEARDHLIRRRAAQILRANDVGDFTSKLGAVESTNNAADYARALRRRRATARVVTDQGAVVIELLPAAAPLTVDSFIRLAQKGFFDGLTFHRVVPNFVIQGGDPRGDGNGGPGYQIRCEINEVPYERGAVGMALSGKDTGGSQWFVTHTRQPHLDGGYTVFGRVVEGMDVVDRIARGDRIRRVVVSENQSPGRGGETRRTSGERRRPGMSRSSVGISNR